MALPAVCRCSIGVKWEILSALIILLVGLTGCHRRAAHPRAPSPPLSPTPSPAVSSSPAIHLPSEEMEGLASWYGHPYHGRRAANGEIYNMNDLTAAHRTLPFDTMVQVHNLENGKDVQVRINDRGPFVNGRIIDLSFAAAKIIEMVGPGISRVRLDILKPSFSNQPLTLQAGAFKEKTNAERLKNILGQTWQPVIIRAFDNERGTYYRVFAGQFSDYSQALQELQKLRASQKEGFIVRLDPELPRAQE
jgi:rare lipoprotein A